MAWEEGKSEDGVDRETSRARHEGQCDHGEQATLAVFNGACRHDGRHVATKAREHGEERFAVESHASKDGVEE